MAGLIDGDYDIAMTAADNVVAYVEGQGEAEFQADPDLIATETLSVRYATQLQS